MTSLLSFGVFMSFILDSMPSSTETLSFVAVNMSGLLVLSALYVLLCILSLRLFHRDPVKHPVPGALQSLVVWLEMLVCLDPPARNKVDVLRMQAADYLASSDVTGRHSDAVGVSSDVTVAAARPNDVRMTEDDLKGRLDKRAMTRRLRQAAYRDPEEMTWRRVSRTLDKLLFRFFFCFVLASNVAVWGVVARNYFNRA